MIRFRNTDNGMIVEVPEWMAPKYDRSVNMERVEPVAESKPKPKAKRTRKKTT